MSAEATRFPTPAASGDGGKKPRDKLGAFARRCKYKDMYIFIIEKEQWHKPTPTEVLVVMVDEMYCSKKN